MKFMGKVVMTLRNWFGLDGYIHIHVDDIAVMQAELNRIMDGLERSKNAGRTSANVAAMASLSCRKVLSRLSYLVQPK